MTKLVNVNVNGKAITCLKHPITRNLEKVYFVTEDIKKILETSDAIVQEVFPDGSLYRLTLENYDRGDLFEVAKQEKEAKAQVKKEQDIAESKFQAQIEAGRSARQQAIAALLNNRNRSLNAMAQSQVAVSQNSSVNSAVEAARQQIEANKNL